MHYPTLASLSPIAAAVSESGSLLNDILGTSGGKPFYRDWTFYLAPGWWIARKIFGGLNREKELREQKQKLYEEAIRRQNEIIRQLQRKQRLNDEYIRRLEDVNERLTQFIRTLGQDLEAA